MTTLEKLLDGLGDAGDAEFKGALTVINLSKEELQTLAIELATAAQKADDKQPAHLVAFGFMAGLLAEGIVNERS